MGVVLQRTRTIAHGLAPRYMRNSRPPSEGRAVSNGINPRAIRDRPPDIRRPSCHLNPHRVLHPRQSGALIAPRPLRISRIRHDLMNA